MGAAASGSSTPGADRAALALWIALIALALLRATLVFVPSMWAWGANLMRFLPTATAWAPWLLAALALVPAIGRRLAPPFERAGELIVRKPAAAGAALAGLAAAWVLCLPDRLYFIGDFMLRLGAARGQIWPGRVFPQATPFDRFFHYDLPVNLSAAMSLDAAITNRLLGALDAAALVILAILFVRALSLSGGAALAAWAVVTCGGYLALLTGYSKAVCELGVLTAAIAAFGVSVAREGRGRIALGVSLTLAILLHRSGLLFAPAAVVAWALDARRRPEAWRRPATWLAVGLPLAAFASVAGIFWTTFTRMDVGIHLAPPETRRAGFLADLLAPMRLADQLDVAVLLSPLAPVAALLAWGPVRARLPRGAMPVLIALLLPLLALLVAVHPHQGTFRDWDDFAAVGVGLSLLTAALAGEALRSAPRRAWLAPAVTLAALVPAAQWLAHQADDRAALHRIRAYVSESPRRGDTERAVTWGWIGGRELSLERWDSAAEAYRQTVAIAPNPRYLFEWGMAEANAGRYASAQQHLLRAATRAPGNPDTWEMLAEVARRAGDRVTARSAAESAQTLRPGSPAAQEILRALGSGDGVAPSPAAAPHPGEPR